MGKYTRGEFLGFSAALAGAFTPARWPNGSPRVSAQQPQPARATGEPDLITVYPRA